MESGEEHLKLIIELIHEVLRKHFWLLDLYVLDYFVDEHWEKLPPSWREAFADMDPKTLCGILCGELPKKILPLSYLALLKSIKLLSIPRERNSKICKIDQKGMSSNACGSHPKLKNLFLKHVKLKKRHEVGLMAEVVNNTAAQTNCKAVLDFGSGLGHLVRVLAYKYDLNAAGIEGQNNLTEGARELDLKLESIAKKHLSEQAMNILKRPTHYNTRLNSHEELLEMDLPETMNSYGLVGLHPCGDLGPLLLKHFVNCEKVKFICLVGCCHMKLTLDGFPLSEFVKALDTKLSHPSLEISCHAIEVYCDRVSTGNYDDLKIHAYRAALEQVLASVDCRLRHAPVRNVKNPHALSFRNYCTFAFEGLERLLAADDAVWSLAEASARSWRRVVLLYTLRLALAPLVETLVLLDRRLFVIEHGFACKIEPVFDPRISPRNHIMIARRQ